MKSLKEVQAKFEESQQKEKEKIRQEPKKSKRFWKWCLYFALFPFKWIWVNFRDWRTIVIFVIVVIIVGSEVWVPFILGIIFNNAWLIGIATACEAFWLAPFTPFLALCIFLTILIKALMNKISLKRKNKINSNLSKEDTNNANVE